MATPEQDALEDLAYANAEGAAELADPSAEDFGEDAGTEDLGSEDSYMADAGEDGFLFGEDGLEAEEAEDTINRMLGQALGAEEEGEVQREE